MDLILNVKTTKTPEKNDLLIYNGKEWVIVSKGEYLSELINNINNIKEAIKDLDELKQQIKELRGEDDEEIPEDNN